MKDYIEYKGYYGSVHYDPDGPIFYGKLKFIKALVSYEGTTAINIKKAFYEAVDDYLLLCEKKNIEAEKPFKGSFNVRPGHELHREVALTASKRGMNLNQFVCQALQNACHKYSI